MIQCLDELNWLFSQMAKLRYIEPNLRIRCKHQPGNEIGPDERRRRRKNLVFRTQQSITGNAVKRGKVVEHARGKKESLAHIGRKAGERVLLGNSRLESAQQSQYEIYRLAQV